MPDGLTLEIILFYYLNWYHYQTESFTYRRLPTTRCHTILKFGLLMDLTKATSEKFNHLYIYNKYGSFRKIKSSNSNKNSTENFVVLNIG